MADLSSGVVAVVPETQPVSSGDLTLLTREKGEKRKRSEEEEGEEITSPCLPPLPETGDARPIALNITVVSSPPPEKKDAGTQTTTTTTEKTPNSLLVDLTGESDAE